MNWQWAGKDRGRNGGEEVMLDVLRLLASVTPHYTLKSGEVPYAVLFSSGVECVENETNLIKLPN